MRTKEQWDLAQVFEVDNPADSPWPGWERLSIDPDAPLGPDDWVAAIEPGATPKKRKVFLGADKERADEQKMVEHEDDCFDGPAVQLVRAVLLFAGVRHGY